MFEGMTYEAILDNMLDLVSNDVDKREGSVIYDALAPCAYHLAETYFSLDFIMDLVSMDTAIGEYLDKAVSNYGITRKPATKAVRKVITSSEVGIGTRWGIHDTVYIITEVISEHEYKAECDQEGSVGNIYEGKLDNIDNVTGVTAILSDVLSFGQEKETDSNLRTRLYSYLQKSSTSGNSFQYMEWALSVPGVGDAKVFPLWNGPGTVKVVIVDNNKQPAIPSLVEETRRYIETVRPIGAEVTVVSGVGKEINLLATLVLAPGYSMEEVTNTLKASMEEYFKEIAFSSYVSIARIGTLLLSTEGVLDYTGLQLNHLESNVILTEEEIPVLGTVELVTS